MTFNEIKDRWTNNEVLTAGIKLTPYQKKQALLKNIAFDWQYELGETNTSWGELCACQNWFYDKAKKYGLVREFEENGIC